MTKVNEFNAIRIALASPEQIKGWSYGEVTKPETINYRTLKPERDGLFCEKIFGPTKDWECYCGKYKKKRFQGVICDKCGVEVQPSKVRRERMGHIDLAAAVAHIWFARGIPSRIGLVLDISPRNLDGILNFAQYILISVDEEAKKKIIEDLENARHQELMSLESAAQLEIDALKGAAEVRRKESEGYGQVETSAEEQIEGEKELARPAKAKSGKKKKDESTLTEDVKSSPFSRELRKIDDELEKEIGKIRARLEGEKDAKDKALKEQADEIKDVFPRSLLSESRYHDLKYKYDNLFRAGTGAEALLEILKSLNLDDKRQELLKDIGSTSGQRRKKASKVLRVVEAFRRSGNKPEWMILTRLPVLPAELRPMVQLDGGRFATSDLNDLYRRVINRNNRLRRLLELGAPEIIINNEKRMLQEAVDALIDNGRRGRAVSSSGNHKLKSLSDMLRGKQGRFRQNLLGKRVDYSGRSVIVAGPELKLSQCGLPRRMALELFKPFIMRKLVEKNLAYNIKAAKRLVDKSKPEVWDILEEIKDRPVLLNRAPTLHRLGIQAFEPVLVDGSAIQVHPLVCTAFNADFDGDQMAVHIPLSEESCREAREVLLSTCNMLLPSNGDPVVTPTLDMVLGCYYLTHMEPDGKAQPRSYANFDEARFVYELGLIGINEEILAKDSTRSGEQLRTSVGRIIFNEVLPEEIGFINKDVNKASLKKIVAQCYKILGNQGTADVLDKIKSLGFHYATQSGITIGMHDLEVPKEKAKILEQAEEEIAVLDSQWRKGLLEEEGLYRASVNVWEDATNKTTEAIKKNLHRYGGIFVMATAGAKGNIDQIRQMAGMRGLMTDPSGRVIDFPIKSSFVEGLTVMEYFISTHGARKGLADTALRTSDSGYLTRRLVDVSQDVIVLEPDCETTAGLWISEPKEKGVFPSMSEKLTGRMAAERVVDPKTGEVLLERNEEIVEEKAKQIVALGISRVLVRSPLGCQAKRGICAMCYGIDLARGKLVQMGEAVGIIAAQSIGEPGTQLTMRTFHTGGVVGLDITTGLPRVEELFEARSPKMQAIISEIDGEVNLLNTEEGRVIKVSKTETLPEEYTLPPGTRTVVRNGDMVQAGDLLAALDEAAIKKNALVDVRPLVSKVSGKVALQDNQVTVFYEETDEKEYPIPSAARIRATRGGKVKAGAQLTDGNVNPQDILKIMGREAVQAYIIDEVQRVYRTQGVTINDKHIEIIVRQMLSKVRVEESGDTDLLPGELVGRFLFEDINNKVLAEGGVPATAQVVLLGITRASLNTESWLAAASFQETTRVLTEAAINGKTDKLQGLKENVIIGKLIPAHCNLPPQLVESKPVVVIEEGERPSLAGGLPF